MRIDVAEGQEKADVVMKARMEAIELELASLRINITEHNVAIHAKVDERMEAMRLVRAILCERESTY